LSRIVKEAVIIILGQRIKSILKTRLGTQKSMKIKATFCPHIIPKKNKRTFLCNVGRRGFLLA
jgi:hypothetical protein